ncbi:hypothetical protein [Salinibacillus xinjiangensis]|uniref:Uncharacterized protein n=1 Tax=Salinibacillus xinjiangensis TaxID=1229268 RepID=A0A6G1X8H4_9BACI|nr:hypothetical protein [Salinibacillus xinjiangensis]MRG87206.1 hypothetical protein [Salinibacillus xinjiangensis]
MNQDNLIKIFRVFVVVALIISLFINFNLLSRLEQIEFQVNQITTNQHNMMSEVSGQSNHIRDVMQDIKQQQSWISNIKMDLDAKKFENGQGEAAFEWQVKELEPGSEVVFHYAFGKIDEFTEIPAEEIQKGLYRASVPIEMDLKPRWEVDMRMDKQALEEQMEQYRLKYFVSVSYDEQSKSSEIQTKDIGDFGTSYYGILQVDLHKDQNNINVRFVNHHINESSFQIKEATIQKYENDTFIGEEKLELEPENNPPEERIGMYKMHQIEQYENMRLVMKVVYDNGKTFEKEIY